MVFYSMISIMVKLFMLGELIFGSVVTGIDTDICMVYFDH